MPVALQVRPQTEQVSRHRVYKIEQLRIDKRDANVQLSALLTQLRDDGFSGQVILHMGTGMVHMIETVEKQTL